MMPRRKQAEAQLRLAEVKLSNAQTLRARNVASQPQAQEAEAQRDIAAAKAEEARARMQLAEFQLSQMTLYAPISGIISRPFTREGAYITKEGREQSGLATIAQLDPIHVVGRTPAAMYFQRGRALNSIEQIAEQREIGLVLPTGDTYPHRGRPVARNSTPRVAIPAAIGPILFSSPCASLASIPPPASLLQEVESAIRGILGPPSIGANDFAKFGHPKELFVRGVRSEILSELEEAGAGPAVAWRFVYDWYRDHASPVRMLLRSELFEKAVEDMAFRVERDGSYLSRQLGVSDCMTALGLGSFPLHRRQIFVEWTRHTP